MFSSIASIKELYTFILASSFSVAHSKLELYFLNFAVVDFAFTFDIYISVIVLINSLYFLYIRLKACLLTFIFLFFKYKEYVLSVNSISSPFSFIKVPNLNSVFVIVSKVFSGAEKISE